MAVETDQKSVRIPPQAEKRSIITKIDSERREARFFKFTQLKSLHLFTVITMVVMFFMPESPYWLLQKGRTDEARRALQWFRGSGIDIEPEMQTMAESHEEEVRIGSISLKALFTHKLYLFPFLLGLFGMFNFQFCGINVVFFYLQTIFDKAGNNVLGSGKNKVKIVLHRHLHTRTPP